MNYPKFAYYSKLLGLILKILEKITEKNHLIDPKQIGFEMQASATDHVFVTDTFYNNMPDKANIYF